MKLPESLTNTRSLMIAILVVALLCLGARLQALSVEYIRISRRHFAARNRATQAMPVGVNPDREQARRERALMDHYNELGNKYDRAARSPWLSIAPDPPEPE
jgi:hypothetical protein